MWEGANDGEGVRVPEWEEALRRVREKDVAERKRKEREEAEEKIEERYRLRREQAVWERVQEKKRAADIQRQKMIAQEKWRKLHALYLEQKERENKRMLERVAEEARLVREERALEASNRWERSKESILFSESVFQLARDLKAAEDVKEEAKKKKAKGEGAFSTQ